MRINFLVSSPACRLARAFFYGLILAGVPLTGAAKSKDYAWSVSPLLGMQAPALTDLVEHEFKAPFSGNADALIDDKQVAQDFSIENPLDPLGYATLAGVEFQWRLNDKHSFLVGGSSWEGISQNEVGGRMYIQGALSTYQFARRHKISYNEFFFGWRYNVAKRGDKNVFYTRLSLHEVFDIDQREDFVFKYLDGKIVTPDTDNNPAGGTVTKLITLQSQATGAMFLQLGVGGEHFITKWLSLGGEVSYDLGLRKVNLRDGKQDTTFQPSDNIDFVLPMSNLYDRVNMYYRRGDIKDFQKLRLDFDGWRALFRINVYY